MNPPTRAAAAPPISRFPVPTLDALPDDVRSRKADITPRQKAMLDFAMKVCLQSDRSLMGRVPKSGR